MIEMLGVLAIIGVLSAGGIMGYSTAMENYRVNKLIDDIKQIVARTNSLLIKPAQTGEGIITNSALYGLNILPSHYKISENKGWLTIEELFNTNLVASVRNQTATFTYPNYTVNAKRYVRIQINTLSTAVCRKLLLHDWRNSEPAFLTRVCTVTNGSSCDYTIDDAPPSVDWTEQACQKHDENGYIMIIWYFFTEGTKTKR